MPGFVDDHRNNDESYERKGNSYLAECDEYGGCAFLQAQYALIPLYNGIDYIGYKPSYQEW
jgi:hypothetical protein